MPRCQNTPLQILHSKSKKKYYQQNTLGVTKVNVFIMQTAPEFCCIVIYCFIDLLLLMHAFVSDILLLRLIEIQLISNYVLCC